MEKKLRLGVVGIGGMGTGHLRSYRNIPNAKIVAICDIYPGRAAERVAEFFPDAQVFFAFSIRTRHFSPRMALGMNTTQPSILAMPCPWAV